MNYFPQPGDIIKMRSWHGIVLDVFKNDTGKTVLQVQTARNLFRKLGPELIEVDLAPQHISSATLEELQQEITVHQQMQEAALTNFLAQVKQPDIAKAV